MLPVVLVNHHVRGGRHTGGNKKALRKLLVETRGRGEDAITDVLQSGELEQALHGSVLAEWTVQHGEDHVDGGQRRAGTIRRNQVEVA